MLQFQCTQRPDLLCVLQREVRQQHLGLEARGGSEAAVEDEASAGSTDTG